MRSPGNRVAAFVPYTNELILSGHFQKKVITVNYDFPGYLYATVQGADPALCPLQKNQIFYRETTAPGLYAPLLAVNIHTSSGATPTTIDVANADKNKLGSGATALLKAFDNSAKAYASGGNDLTRYISTIGADDSGGSGYATQTLSGAMAWTPEDDVDFLVSAIDSGVLDFINYVIVDQEIDFRAAAKPAAIGSNFAIDALYVARINQRMLNGYDAMPSYFLDTWKAACQRIIVDNPQI